MCKKRPHVSVRPLLIFHIILFPPRGGNLLANYFPLATSILISISTPAGRLKLDRASIVFGVVSVMSISLL